MNSIGFVGTADSLTHAQTGAVRKLLMAFNPQYVHHGDCKGSDVDVHNVALQTTARIVAHPPADQRKRAHLPAHLVLSPVGFVSRFRSIVACSDLLLVAMPEPGSHLRKGMVDLVRRGVAPDAFFIVVDADGLHSKQHGRRKRRGLASTLRFIQRSEGASPTRLSRHLQ